MQGNHPPACRRRAPRTDIPKVSLAVIQRDLNQVTQSTESEQRRSGSGNTQRMSHPDTFTVINSVLTCVRDTREPTYWPSLVVVIRIHSVIRLNP